MQTIQKYVGSCQAQNKETKDRRGECVPFRVWPQKSRQTQLNFLPHKVRTALGRKVISHRLIGPVSTRPLHCVYSGYMAYLLCASTLATEGHKLTFSILILISCFCYRMCQERMLNRLTTLLLPNTS